MATFRSAAKSPARRSRRARALGIGAGLTLGITGALGAALPAGATLTSPANNLIVGSGAQVSYDLMQALDTVFNDAPGCGLTTTVSTAPQPLDFSCVTSPQDATQSAQEQAGYTENPLNDVAVEEPPLGSSNGILQLEDSGAHGASAASNGTPINVADNVNFARSSRGVNVTAGSSAGDLQGLNFVAYAENGISWFHYTTTSSGQASASSAVTNLSEAQLLGIVNGTIDNWSEVGGADAPIVVYSPNSASGVTSTVKSYLGYDPSKSSDPVNCATAGTPNTENTANTVGTNCAGPEIIFQNEDEQVGQLPSTNPSGGSAGTLSVGGTTFTQGSGTDAAQVQSDAFFFFSYGNFEVSCTANKDLGIKKNADCGGAPLGTARVALGDINGITLDEQSILAQAVPGQSSGLTAWPLDQYLYNVYANGSNANIPAATPATVNYVSEVGFLCKPQLIDQNYQNTATTDEIQDPNTGAWYRVEIDNAITSAGFFPISTVAKNGKWTTTPVDEGNVDTPASKVNDVPVSGSPNAAFSTSVYGPNDDPATNPTTHDPVGYCYVVTSDGNSTS